MSRAQYSLVLRLRLFGVFALWILKGSAEDGMLHLPNLNHECFACLCYVATTCDMSHRCTNGYCGPFNISRDYWEEAGRVTLPYDDPNRNLAWQSCARSYHCALEVILGYLGKYGKDCNDDGVTNCYDYMMVNGNEGDDCTTPLNRTEHGRRWLARFEECRF